MIFIGMKAFLTKVIDWVDKLLKDEKGQPSSKRIMGLMMAPVGAIIVAEHWLFPRIGLTRYWSQYKGNNTNWAAIITWLTALALSYVLEQSGVLHLFFLLKFLLSYIMLS